MLSKEAIKYCRTTQSKPIYFRGDIISRDIKQEFLSANIECDEMTCYEVKNTNELSEHLQSSITQGSLKIAIFFSKNTAEVFVSLCKKYDIAKFLKETTILTISSKLKFYLELELKGKIKTFEGDEASLIKLVKSYYV